MGRSVSRPSESFAVAYEYIDYNEDDTDFQWDDYKEGVINRARKIAPSFSECDTWPGREDHAILENSFCYLGISEYCGLVAVWLLPKELEGDRDLSGLQSQWLGQMEGKFHKVFGTLNKVGIFSNGEAVFSRKETAK